MRSSQEIKKINTILDTHTAINALIHWHIYKHHTGTSIQDLGLVTNYFFCVLTSLCKSTMQGKMD